MKLRVLSWNMCGRGRGAADALALVPSLVREFQPSILTLLEAPGDAEARLRDSGLPIHLANREIGIENHRRLLTFRLDERLTVAERVTDRHFRAYEVSRDGYDPLNLVTVHLRSPLHDKVDVTEARERKRADQCRAFVETVEDLAGHERTVVYGDFNMDPFSSAMVDIDGLNAVSTAFRARRRRQAEGTTRATLYNPMWSQLGDRPSPAGSLFVDDDGPAGYFWHMPDQVLMRAQLIDHLGAISIIDQVDSTRLVSPRAETPSVSDHLPLLFELDESVWTRCPP